MSTARWFPDEMPLPGVNAETNGWWEAAASHRLVIQTCSDCGQTRHPPGPVCPRCRSTRSHWLDLPGTGTVFTFTVVRQAFISSLADHIPYVVIVVDLDGVGADRRPGGAGGADGPGGARLVSNLVAIDPADVFIGMEVVLVWEDMGPQLAVPRFRPATSPTDPTEQTEPTEPKGTES